MLNVQKLLARPKQGKKPQKKSLPSLIAKADEITSQYIRRKHADASGNVACVTCNKVLHWKEMHCAHYIERASKATRWMEENLRPACPSCNVYRKEFHKREYTLVMIDCYGRQGVEELKQQAREVLTPSQVRALAEEAIAEFSARLREME